MIKRSLSSKRAQRKKKLVVVEVECMGEEEVQKLKI